MIGMPIVVLETMTMEVLMAIPKKNKDVGDDCIYIQDDNLKDVVLTTMGGIDFKWAHVDNE